MTYLTREKAFGVKPSYSVQIIKLVKTLHTNCASNLDNFQTILHATQHYGVMVI